MRLSGVAPERILDIGFGSGLLAIRVAELGHEVTGVDDATAMLEKAKTARQVLLEDHDLDRALEAAQEHLVPGGALAFDTRNPSGDDRHAMARSAVLSHRQ